jgi:nitronate monooxygenase
LIGRIASITSHSTASPAVVDAFSIPVIAAGGVGDARDIVAAFALGAEGGQIGTAFLACEESGASRLHRDAILSGKARRTGLPRGFAGRLARGIHNQLMEELNRPGVEILPYPLQRNLVKHLTALAEKAGNLDLLQLWAGQSASLSRESDVLSFLQTLVAEVSSIAEPVQDWSRDLRGV